MKEKRVNLHLDQKRALLMMLFFAVAFFAMFLLAALILSKNSAQLNSLLQSDYVYSAITANPVHKDDYYRFDAGISFALSADANKSINATILMQPNEAVYTDLVDWNAGILGTNSVAITHGLARSNGLNIGDIIFSKHVTDGTLHRYTIEQLLPEVVNERVSSQQSYQEGIIIIGYDSQYVDNISHSSLVFTKESIEDLGILTSGMPENIVYRDDEITAVSKRLLPYWGLFTLLSVLISYVFVFLLTKEIRYNYKRLIVLGFKKRDLNHSYYTQLYAVCIPPILVAFSLAMLGSQIWEFSFVEAVLLFALLLWGILTIFISIKSSNCRMWR